MAQVLNRLSARFVSTVKTPGDYPDGGGLYLQVSSVSAKSWLLRYRFAGKEPQMGLGSVNDVSLIAARKKRSECRTLLDQGKDPRAERDQAKARDRLEAAKAMTFGECAEAYVESHRAGWRNAKHVAQWTSTLKTYAGPVFGALPVQAIDTALVMQVLEPLWSKKTETAARLRGRIENILDWAKVRGYREGENPARWRGHLDKLLPKRSKVAKVEHHAALPYAKMGDFMKELRAREGVAPKALEFVILTAARISEAVKATWDEIDLSARIWTVPAARMKAGREHRVPLSPAAVTVLKAMEKLRQSSYIFPGWREKRPITSDSCLKLLGEMDYPDITVHGFRSTFRDWAAETTNFPREICEAAMAHVLGNKAEAAYQRGDLLERRRKLMEAWAAYCSKSPVAVVLIQAHTRKVKRSA
ncbi:MAG: integrase arm-type DNA-binding domain-containing protein [Burkholderiales bacterium]|nr:integrase arm-type DNA-binding domain-containing protein [Burkholderiales bacterium]